MDEPVVVVGGSIAALVAAREAARCGRAVELLLPRGTCGRGFVDVDAGPRRLRAGARLLELSYGGDQGPAPSLETYRPGPAGHVPFMGLVRETILELADGQVTEAPTPLLTVGGRTGPDIHMTADLRTIASLLDPAERAAVAAEATAIEAALGPSGVLGDPRTDPWTLPFEDASLANHGPTFHRLLVAPVAEKVIAGGAGRIATALRRKAWLALFHPRTVRQAAAGDEVTYAPHRPFHVDSSGGCSAVVGALIRSVAADRRIAVRTTGRLLEIAPTGELRFDDGGLVASAHPVLALPAGEVFAAAGIAHSGARVSVDLTWVEVAEADVEERPSAVLLADPDLDAYRVSEGGTGFPGTVLFAVEGGAEAAEPAEALERAGVIRPGAALRVVRHASASVGSAPDPGAAAAFAAAADRLAREAPWVRPIAGAAALGADSFNEQIIAGIHAGRRAAA